MDQEFRNQLCDIVGSDNTYTEEPMRKHTTFRIGGPADYYVTPHTKEEIRDVIRACQKKQIPYCFLGNGSNVLVGDLGYRGTVIQIFKNFSDIQVEKEGIRAQSGALLSKIAKKAMKNGLAGMEFASGIPGTLGGAVMMNAGAYGGEMKDILKEAVVLTESGEFLTLSCEELELGYRTSLVAKKHYLVLEAVLNLKKGNSQEIQAKMEELKEKRVSKQPLEFPSAGSTFKRPEGYFAGKLIMDAGLGGFSVGDAQVSEKHCGFVINRGEASAQDVRMLMDEVTRRVHEKFGVTLEPEVRMLGEFK